LGSLAANIQNQGDSGSPCLARSRVAWEYVDNGRSGWPWTYDFTAKLTCPSDGCSLNKCGFNAECVDRGRGVAKCVCKRQYEGNPYQRCYPSRGLPKDCNCRELILSSTGQKAAQQSDKMGTYYFYAYVRGKPAYQHRSGLDYLYFVGNAWAIGPEVDGNLAGLMNFNSEGSCPYKMNTNWFLLPEEEDPTMHLQCNDLGQATSISGEQTNY